MREYYNGFLISDEKDLLQLERIHELLSSTYWAASRDIDTIQKSINNSLCFGVYKDDVQIGFARCVTDYAVIFWLCDVIIHKDFRKQGLGRKLVEQVILHEKLKDLRGILTTNTHHQAFYAQYGFEPKTSFMFKPNKPR